MFRIPPLRKGSKHRTVPSAVMSVTGLPTVPSCLKESLKTEKRKSKNREKSHSLAVHNSTKTNCPNTLESLNTKMSELREMDRQLFHQLWAVYESIQEHKQSYLDRLSETNSECSSVVSYNLDNQLETIPDFQEHIYVNEKFHQHIYENQSFHEVHIPSSSLAEREENTYDSVYVESERHANVIEDTRTPELKPRTVERSSSRVSTSSTSGKSNRFPGVFTQTTYESSL